MVYRHYDTLVLYYKVEVFNWPMEDQSQMKDPSYLGGLSKLQERLDLIKKGKCGFRRLTDDAWEKWKQDREAAIEAGHVIVTQRKQRSDAGVKKRPVQAAASSARSKKASLFLVL